MPGSRRSVYENVDFIHGAACMSLTGDYDLTDQQTMQLLEHSYYAFTMRQCEVKNSGRI